MRPCVIIPYYKHPATIAAVAREASAYCPVIVVDDGSTPSLSDLPGITVVRLEANRGKGSALRAGFQRASREGFTHALTMDADGQHSPKDLPKYLSAAEAQPDALIVGVRDFIMAGCPTHRRRSNAVSTFWFRVETGVRLGDTQCGFRCYPLDLARKLKVRSERYAFELEFMVRAAWTGAPIVPVPVACSYSPDQLRQSHFRPVIDLAHITLMNIGLVLQSWVVPRSVRIAWSFGERRPPRELVRDFFAENAEEPGRMACSVGLGLFCGIAPIWGYQMLVAAALAHFLRLNKATTLLASNISIPPVMPFILYGALALGHWLFTGQTLALHSAELTRTVALRYAWEWCVGSLALGGLVAAAGTLGAYALVKLLRRG